MKLKTNEILNIDKTSNNNIHRYYPDFKINNIWYEIKSDYLFDKENNVLLKQGRTPNFEKTKCLNDNNVKLLFKNDLKPILKYINEKYGKLYLLQFKCKKKI